MEQLQVLLQVKTNFKICLINTKKLAFGAPIGGVLFALEEASSFWSKELTWRTFFGCMISAFTVNVLLAGFNGSLMNDYGLLTFGVSRSSLYHYQEMVFFVLLGAISGFVSVIFIKVNMKIGKWRRDYIATNKWARLGEVKKQMICIR